MRHVRGHGHPGRAAAPAHRRAKGSSSTSALLDSQLAWLTHVAGAFFANGQRPQKLGNAHATIVPYQPFRAADKYVIVAVGSERLWERFCAALEIEQYASAATPVSPRTGTACGTATS